MVQRRVLIFFINWQRNTSSVGDMLQHLNWRSLKGRGKDARLVMMYKVAKENVAITKHDSLIHHCEIHGTCTESGVTFVIELGIKVCVKK